jgi:hypothetical protein
MSTSVPPGASSALELGRVEQPRGSAVFYEPAPGVLLLRVQGHIPMEAAAAAIQLRDKSLRARANIHLFDDAWEATSYDSAARLALTEWAKQNASRIGSHHLLLRSKILAMGVSVANLALRQQIAVHTAPEAFAKALDLACAAAARTRG